MCNGIFVLELINRVQNTRGCLEGNYHSYYYFSSLCPSYLGAGQTFQNWIDVQSLGHQLYQFHKGAWVYVIVLISREFERVWNLLKRWELLKCNILPKILIKIPIFLSTPHALSLQDNWGPKLPQLINPINWCITKLF